MGHNPDTSDAARRSVVAPSADASPAEWNWQAVVATAFPGTSTPAQREQLARAMCIEGLLTSWSSAFGTGLVKQFVRPSALFAIASTPPDLADSLTLSLARLIYWIYSLDTALDALDPRDDGSAVLLLQLAAAPLIEQLGSGAFTRYGWNPSAQDEVDSRAGLASRHPRLAREVPVRGPLLATALRSLLAETSSARLEIANAGHSQAHAARAERSGELTLQQLAHCICALRQELLWSPARRPIRMPDTGLSGAQSAGMVGTAPALLEAYLAIATRTTGVHPTSALICWIGSESEDAWLHAQPAIQAAARVVRLANDLYGAREDHAQGHFTALTAALPHHRLWSRHRPRGSRRLTQLIHEKPLFQHLAISPQIARSTQSHRTVARALTTAIATFVETSVHLDPGLLAFYLQHVVAAALARYSTRLHTT